jgi:hypothetical protein
MNLNKDYLAMRRSGKAWYRPPCDQNEAGMILACALMLAAILISFIILKGGV